VKESTTTDLALIKINASGLAAATIGDSSQIQVGQTAIAIGSPLGTFTETVTKGIISGLGREITVRDEVTGQPTHLTDLIQTDAAINPGNSGGALVDANGNLTGINTAIFSKSGGSQGIGFAIPVKLAMEVMKSIIEHGQVIRGWLGIEVQPLSQELAESFGLSGRPGIVVAGIFRDGPAQKAGLQLGDVILSIDGEPAGDGRRSMNQVARIKPTDHVTIQVMRNGKELKLTAEIGLRPPPAPVKEKEEE
jgi:serine protease DegS